MYAIIKACGRQYRVEQGTVFEMDRLEGSPGDVVTLEDAVLLLSEEGQVSVGSPTVPGAKVELEIREHLRGTKLTVFKMKRRKRYRRKHGHRQELTRVAVMEIVAG
ncbi:MAG: 50S ribosomal protein L21 [Lentisphaeria bacterium]|nr:50S ribosomal protein L21 [Lentisphaeria bacterium]